MVKPLNTQPAFGRFSISPKRWKRFRNSRMLVVATPNCRASSSSLMSGPGRVLSRSIHSMKRFSTCAAVGTVSALGKRRTAGAELQHTRRRPPPAMIALRVAALASTLRTVVRLTPSRALSAFSDGRPAPTSRPATRSSASLKARLNTVSVFIPVPPGRSVGLLIHKKQIDERHDRDGSLRIRNRTVQGHDAGRHGRASPRKRARTPGRTSGRREGVSLVGARAAAPQRRARC